MTPAELAQIREALDAVQYHHDSTFMGPDAEKHRRASWRGAMRKVRAALAILDRSKS